MADEARITSSLQIIVDNTVGRMEYISQPTAFEVDVTGVKGPTPGAITVSRYGTNVDLSQLTVPGLCQIMNLDPVDTGNYVEYGIWDPDTLSFYPLGEIGPGESYVLKLSRNLQQQYGTGTGTGTTELANTKLRFRANANSVNVFVGAFEK